MAGSVNKVILVGNLGADPEIRRTQDGRPIANLRVATSESWRDKETGERQRENRMAPRRHLQRGACKIAEQYLKKGAKVYLEGELQTRKWQDKDGQDRYSTEVVLQGFNSALTMLDRAEAAARALTTAAISARPARRHRASASLQWRPLAASTTTWMTRFRFDLSRPHPVRPRESGEPGQKFLTS